MSRRGHITRYVPLINPVEPLGEVFGSADLDIFIDISNAELVGSTALSSTLDMAFNMEETSFLTAYGDMSVESNINFLIYANIIDIDAMSASLGMQLDLLGDLQPAFPPLYYEIEKQANKLQRLPIWVREAHALVDYVHPGDAADPPPIQYQEEYGFTKNPISVRSPYTRPFPNISPRGI